MFVGELCPDVASLSIVEFVKRDFDSLPERFLGTVCRNHDCVPVDVRAADLDQAHWLVRGDDDSENGTFQPKVGRWKGDDLAVMFWLTSPGVDGDVYSIQLSDPGGEWVLEHQQAVTYNPVRREGRCPPNPHWSATVFLD